MSLNQDIRYKAYNSDDIENPYGFTGEITSLKPAYSYHTGLIPPTSNIGVSGDMYIDTGSGVEYKKIGSSWVSFYTFPDSGGTITGAGNIGTGTGVFDSVFGGNQLLFKTLTAGSNVSISSMGDDVIISSATAPVSGVVSVGLGGAIDIQAGLDMSNNIQIKRIKNTGPSIDVIDFMSTVNVGLADGIYCSTISQNFPNTGVTIEGVKLLGTEMTLLSAINGSNILTTYNNLSVNNVGVLSWAKPAQTYRGLIVNSGGANSTQWWNSSPINPADGEAIVIDNVARNIISFSFKFLYSANWSLTSATGTIRLEVGYIPSFSVSVDANFVLLGFFNVNQNEINPQVVNNLISYVLPAQACLVVRQVNALATTTATTCETLVTVVVA